MSEPNRRPGVAWTIPVLIVGLVLYILSAGPLAWLIGKCGWPEYLLVPFDVIYKPLEMAQGALPAQIGAPYDRYMSWWLSEFLPPPATATSPAPPPVPLPDFEEGQEIESAEAPE